MFIIWAIVTLTWIRLIDTMFEKFFLKMTEKKLGKASECETDDERKVLVKAVGKRMLLALTVFVAKAATLYLLLFVFVQWGMKLGMIVAA